MKKAGENPRPSAFYPKIDKLTLHATKVDIFIDCATI